MFTSFVSGCSLAGTCGGVEDSSGAAAGTVAAVVDGPPRRALPPMLILGPGLSGLTPPPMLSRGLKSMKTRRKHVKHNRQKKLN